MTKEAETIAEGHGWWSVLIRRREASLVLLIALLTFLTTALNPRFLSPQSLKDLMLNVSIIALLVLGQTIIILMRQIDLSISSIVGITAFLSGTLFVNHPGIPGVVVVLIAILTGFLLGGVNAVLIAWGKIPALITSGIWIVSPLPQEKGDRNPFSLPSRKGNSITQNFRPTHQNSVRSQRMAHARSIPCRWAELQKKSLLPFSKMTGWC